MRLVVSIFAAVLLTQAGRDPRPATGQSPAAVVVDDFEGYAEGDLPVRWKYLRDRKLIPLRPEHMRPTERFYVTGDRGNNVLRVHTEGEAVHLTMANEPDGFDWDVRTHPRIAWDWRALELPPGAREDLVDLNDTGAAVYVVFDMDGFLFKRPRSIKYTYSSTLPVGTVVSYGKLKVIVVSSAREGMGQWRSIERDVAADFRMVFGEDVPSRPLSIRLWGDSDNTGAVADAEFDNVRLLPPSGTP